MICVYAPDCTDFSNNGMGTIGPQSCIVTETLNGEWELTLIHPIDERGKWRRLTEGCIVKAPVPAAPTPRIQISLPEHDDLKDVYVIDTDNAQASVRGGTLRLRTGPGTGYKTIQQYKNGTTVQVISKTNAAWYEVILPDGKHGYMDTRFLRFDHTEGSYSEAVNAVVESRQMRDQPFRIYRIVPELDKITVYARHVFYDLLDNMIQSLEPSSATPGASVVQTLSSCCLSDHDFTLYSNLTSTAKEVTLRNINPVEAMLGEGGIAEKYGAELARDWFDVFLVERIGTDSDVQIRERKNLTGISYDVDETNVVTRIMPTGEDADGNILYLPELYIDSSHSGAYAHPKWVHLAVSEAKEVAEGDDYKSLTSCYEDMRAAAQAEYEKGCDLPNVTLKVDFINCKDTEEYRQYAALTDIFLGDSVRVIARRIDIEVTMRMTQYTYDCLTKKYTSVTLGTAAATLEGTTISARQLASGSITGAKLALNSVGAGQLQNGSVGSLQIKNAAIGSAHIQSASITQAHIAEALIDVLNVNALNAVTAKIKELAAGSITTDELYASIAMISTAQLTTANIINANIDWAQIESLAAEIATISKAQITTANINEANIEWAAITTLSAAVASMVKADIGSADIDWAHIKDLATDTAIITQGVGGELYIAKLAVTEANLVSLTVGELVVKGEDGHFYSVSVDAEGNITTALKQIGNDDVQDVSINAGEKIIEGTITAGTLNVQNIFGDNATIKSMIAANLDVDTLFAREATIRVLNAMDITSNTYLRLMVDGKADKAAVDALGERMNAAELKITEDAIIQTVTGSQQYQEDIAAASSTGAGSVFVVGTQTTTTAAWTGVANIAQLRDGQEITYWLPYGSGSNVTLTLTLADGTTTEAVPCYYSQGTRLGTQYVGGNIIHLTYRENAKYFTTTIAKGWWADANYNTDTYDRIRFGTIKAKSAISASRLIVGDDTGYFQLAAGVPFNVRKPILWTPYACSANSSTSNGYLAYSSIYLLYHISNFAGAMGESLYLVGSLNGDTFTPATTYLTSVVPTAEDGYTYMLLGHLTSTYYASLIPEHPLYCFVDGVFKPLEQVGYEAYTQIGTLREETQTAIEQTNAAIALKADRETTDALTTRVEAAEQKITPAAITSTVTQAALYAFEKMEGRNYCLASDAVQTLVDNKYQPNNGLTVNRDNIQYKLSDDFFAHSENGAKIRISFEIKRTNIDASAASTANVYCGVWMYYRLQNGESVSTVGRGWYMRTTETDFQATDEDWVKVRFSNLNLSSYNPIGFAYLAIGSGGVQNITGTIQVRNVKIEAGDTWTDWSAAPEDIYGLAGRMDTAETRITQNSNNINLKVSTSTYNTEKVYRSSTVPTTLYSGMLWLDLSLSPPILKRYTGSSWVAVGAQEVKTSGVSISSNQVSITTENFLLQLLDPANNENVLMEMSANGNVGFKELYADEVISDSVAQAYFGPINIQVTPSATTTSASVFRSLGDAVQAVNNRYLREDVTIFLPYGVETYEAAGIVIRGVMGPGKLRITGYGASSTLNSFIRVTGCSAHVEFYSLALREIRGLNAGSYQSYLVELNMNHYVTFNYCTLDANNVTYDSVYCKGGYAYLNSCGLYNALQGLEVFTGVAFAQNCKGSCSWAMISYASIIMAAGTVPAGSRGTGNNGQIYTTGVTTDYGTAIPTITPDETTIQYATTTRSWRGSWRTDTLDVVQGVYSDYGYSSTLSWNRGCIWFSNLRNVLSGTTIKSATLTLHRKTGSGAAAAKTVYLCAISNTSASGTPSIAYNYGGIGTIGRDKQITFSIPISLVQGLANGSYGGLCLYESPYDFGNSTYSNAYMRMSGTDTYLEPYLEVVYSGGDAVG